MICLCGILDRPEAGRAWICPRCGQVFQGPPLAGTPERSMDDFIREEGAA